ncbi:hypothetical protein HDU76_012392 [Blyttiomyces sp. JEL0837]|nr:hypothetical protein HDU76_012392 [Blyttiomyces sp. JEL0837]
MVTASTAAKGSKAFQRTNMLSRSSIRPLISTSTFITANQRNPLDKITPCRTISTNAFGSARSSLNMGVSRMQCLTPSIPSTLLGDSVSSALSSGTASNRTSSLLILNQIRTKTFRKKVTKPQKRYFTYVERLKASGEPVPPVQRNVMENKFWKVVGNMKIYKPVSPGCRNRRHPIRFHLHKGSCIRRLSYGKRSNGGRNKTGKITVRHQGGGHKRRVRIVDFHRSAPGPHEVVRLEYDPNRTSELALLRNLSTNEFSYIPRPEGMEPGQIVNSYRSGIPEPEEGQDPIARNQIIQVGNAVRLRDIPVGTLIHCIGLRPDGPAQLCRSAGTFAQLIATGISSMGGYEQAQVRLSSKEVRYIPSDCVATIGVVGNKDHHHTNLGKAGASRRLGIRPTTRGIAMNACDHPTGGGSKSKGNKHPRSPWGWLTKGWKTVRRKRWYIITPRWKAKLNRS